MKFPIMAVTLLALAACGGNPLNNGGPGGSGSGGSGGSGNPTGGTTGVPTAILQNLKSASYNAGTDTLTITMQSLDAGTASASYTRNAALDVPGFKAYSSQQSPLDRLFIAETAQSTDGTVGATVVADGGQFNKFFAGATYGRSGSATMPTTGEAKFAGSYAGITNMAGTGADLQPVSGSPDPSTLPSEAMRVTGDGFMIVNFADKLVNGSIYNRTLVGGDAGTQPGGRSDLPPVTLTAGTVATTGSYTGDVQFHGRPDLGTQGSYAGVIGGGAQPATAGAMQLNAVYPTDDPRYNVFQKETGAFVFNNCLQAGSPAICASAVVP